MKVLDLTLATPAENLALDEALLDWAEADANSDEDTPPGGPERRDFREVLRLWEPTTPFVVLGRGSQIEAEVDLDACQRLGVPVLRRASGGAAVVVGPGCLMYAVVLSYDLRPELRMLDAAHRFVLGRVAGAVAGCHADVKHAGTSDLVLTPVVQAASLHAAATDFAPATDNLPAEAGSFGYGADDLRKFSGNSLRCKRTHFLYHGTLMYDFDIGLIEKCLRMPPREPDYRGGRSHRKFLVNLPVRPPELRRELARAWQATDALNWWPREETAHLARRRYSCDDWTIRKLDGVA